MQSSSIFMLPLLAQLFLARPCWSAVHQSGHGHQSGSLESSPANYGEALFLTIDFAKAADFWRGRSFAQGQAKDAMPILDLKHLDHYVTFSTEEWEEGVNKLLRGKEGEQTPTSPLVVLRILNVPSENSDPVEVEMHGKARDDELLDLRLVPSEALSLTITLSCLAKSLGMGCAATLRPCDAAASSAWLGGLYPERQEKLPEEHISEGKLLPPSYLSGSTLVDLARIIFDTFGVPVSRVKDLSKVRPLTLTHFGTDKNIFLENDVTQYENPLVLVNSFRGKGGFYERRGWNLFGAGGAPYNMIEQGSRIHQQKATIERIARITLGRVILHFASPSATLYFFPAGKIQTMMQSSSSVFDFLRKIAQVQNGQYFPRKVQDDWLADPDQPCCDRGSTLPEESPTGYNFLAAEERDRSSLKAAGPSDQDHPSSGETAGGPSFSEQVSLSKSKTIDFDRMEQNEDGACLHVEQIMLGDCLERLRQERLALERRALAATSSEEAHALVRRAHDVAVGYMWLFELGSILAHATTDRMDGSLFGFDLNSGEIRFRRYGSWP